MEMNVVGEVISEVEIYPKLISPAVPGQDEGSRAGLADGSPDDTIGQAGVIARRILLGNIAEREWGGGRLPVLLTGGMKYLELWGRDSAASLAALPASHRQVWRNTLEAFLDHQRPDGLLPRKIAGFGNAERNLRSIVANRGIFLPVSPTLTPEYRTVGYAGSPGSRHRWRRRSSSALPGSPRTPTRSSSSPWPNTPATSPTFSTSMRSP
jgi:hypothetical protein